MPPFGAALKDEEIWDLVNYAMSLPFQKGSESPGAAGADEDRRDGNRTASLASAGGAEGN